MKIFLKNLKEESVVYQKVDTNLNFVDREKQVEKFWKENHIFEKSMEDRKDDPTYMSVSYTHLTLPTN